MFFPPVTHNPPTHEGFVGTGRRDWLATVRSACASFKFGRVSRDGAEKCVDSGSLPERGV